MIRRLLPIVLAVAVALPAAADFAEIARAIDAQRGVSRVWIPFLGVARVAIRIVEPKGVSDFQLVTFRGASEVDPRVLHQIVRSKVGAGFSPLVQVRSRRGESSVIYARPSRDGETLELVILAQDDEETVLVRVEVEAEAIAREIERHPRGVTSVARR